MTEREDLTWGNSASAKARIERLEEMLDRCEWWFSTHPEGKAMQQAVREALGAPPLGVKSAEERATDPVYAAARRLVALRTDWIGNGMFTFPDTPEVRTAIAGLVAALARE